MKKLFALPLVIFILMTVAAEAKLNEPGTRDPGDLNNPETEIRRQKEEADRRQREFEARTLSKKREIEERAINLLAESIFSTSNDSSISTKLDEIELGDVATEEVLSFKNSLKVKLKNALLEKRELQEEKDQDEILGKVKI